MKALTQLLLTSFFFLPMATSAQVQYTSAQALKDSIQAFKTNTLLNAYLIENDFITEELTLDLSAHQMDSTAFTTDGIEIDVFTKNLMGDHREELVIQLREQRGWLQIHSVSIFHFKNGNWLKVPGQLSSPQLPPGRMESNFYFMFEEVAAKGRFNIITSVHYVHNARTEATDFELISVTPQKITTLLSWSKSYSSYSGWLDYFQNSGTSHHLVSKSPEKPYPKQLVLHTTGEGEEKMKFTFEQIPRDTLAGEMYTSKRSVTYSFKLVDGGLYISHTTTTTAEERKYIKPKESKR